jgi:hypothetical protein
VSDSFIDTAATVLAIIVIIVVPIVGIALFWLVHVLPEKIAEKRQHPQKDAIHMLCLLSLVFGGLLWPLAFLWAYSKPVLYKMAYGRDTHEGEDSERRIEPQSQPWQRERPDPVVIDELARLRSDLEELEKLEGPSDDIKAMRTHLARLETRAQQGRIQQGAAH